MVGTILIVAAFILALLEALLPYAYPSVTRRPHLGWLALALFFLSIILGSGRL